jgi:uncharacterized protein YoxC
MGGNAAAAWTHGRLIVDPQRFSLECIDRRSEAKGRDMALKILQVVGAVAVAIIVLFLVPVLLRLRRTLDEVGQVIVDTRPQTISLLKKAQVTLDGVNRELENIEEITEETQVLVGKVGEASEAVERAIKSPMTKAGLITAGVATTGVAVGRRLSRKKSGKG